MHIDSSDTLYLAFLRSLSFFSLFIPYLIAFGSYLLIINKIRANTGQILAITILVRLATFSGEPKLSTDYFRFLWDGKITASHPDLVFSKKPREFLRDTSSVEGLGQNLFDQLNSQEYFSVYPPICQFIWSTLSGSDINEFVWWLRLCMILFEVGSVYLIILILQKLGKPKEKSLLYALNPLIIIELSGNLHPEGFMVFFMATASYLLISYLQKTQALGLNQNLIQGRKNVNRFYSFQQLFHLD
jgi:alpha-1,6-mannosyltransferase